MSIEHHGRAGYRTLPWKNGLGETDEIYLSPPDGSRDAFDLRISSAPILEQAAFSAFPGVDRVITLIAGAGLDLDFGDTTQHLAPLSPLQFDSGLAPVGRPAQGPVRVVNIMAARNRWRFADARVLAGTFAVAALEGNLIVVFAVEGEWHFSTKGQRQALAARDTLLVRSETGLELAADSAASRALFVRLVPCNP